MMMDRPGSNSSLASRFRPHGGDDLAGLTLDGEPIERAPDSMESAKTEIDALIVSIQTIDAQLTDQRNMGHRFTSAAEFDDWRRRSLAAKKLKVFRLRFLKRWVSDQHRVLPSSWTTAPTSRLEDTSVSKALRQLAQRAGQMEAVYYAALRHMDADTDESWAKFRETVERAESIIGGIPASLADKFDDGAAA